METVTSFLVNHDTLSKGVFLSNTERNISTFDLRFKKPNEGDFLSTASAHTIEHIFATVIRNSAVKEKVVYFGPMGCRTGFYLLMFDTTLDEVKPIVKECFEKCLEINEIPGAKRHECGNYLDHDLDGAKAEIRAFLPFIK